MQPLLLPGDAGRQSGTEQQWLTQKEQVPCQTFKKGSPKPRGMQLGFQILGWALRLLKRNRFCRSVIVVKGLSNWFWNFWHLKQCKNRCVGLSAWEGVVPQMYWGGLSVEGERWGVSVCFTQPCSILCLLQVVGQSSGYFCLNWDTSPHLCGGGMGSGG